MHKEVVLNFEAYIEVHPSPEGRKIVGINMILNHGTKDEERIFGTELFKEF